MTDTNLEYKGLGDILRDSKRLMELQSFAMDRNMDWFGVPMVENKLYYLGGCSQDRNMEYGIHIGVFTLTVCGRVFIRGGTQVTVEFLECLNKLTSLSPLSVHEYVIIQAYATGKGVENDELLRMHEATWDYRDRVKSLKFEVGGEVMVKTIKYSGLPKLLCLHNK